MVIRALSSVNREVNSAGINVAGSQSIGNSLGPAAPIDLDSNSSKSSISNLKTSLTDIDDRLPTSVCEVPELLLSPHFTGRSDELEQIQRALDDIHDDIPSRCVAYGMPGLGKTQLVLKYAMLAFKECRYQYIF